MKKLEGKIAVITGGNSGIGFDTAKAFIENGAKVIITGRDQAKIDKAAHDLGHGTVAILSDAGNMNDVRHLAAKVGAVAPKIDILFVNAGVFKGAPFAYADEAHYDELFNINVKGLYFTTQVLLPLINQGGSVIFNASVVAHKGLANAGVYSATKAAVLSFSRTISLDLLEQKIRVNTISPGPIATPIYDKTGLPKEQIEQFAAHIGNTVPLKRFGQGTDIAKAAVFLASDDSTYLLGADIVVDGGILIA